MHSDSIKNYRTPWSRTGELPSLEGMTHEQVVHTYWDNSRYQHVTGDRQMDRVTPALHGAWGDFWAASKKRGGERDDAFRQVREAFEQNGWYGSPSD